MTRLLACVLAATALLAAMGAGDAASQQEASFRVAFVSPAPVSRVCVMDVTTEAQACLPHDFPGVSFIDLAWSPDGTMVAASFVQHTSGVETGSGVAVFSADGSATLPLGGVAPRLIGQGAVFGRPMWSPDSRQVAAAGPGGIVIHDLVDEATRTIGPTPVTASAAAWSPDGSVFAVAAADGGGIKVVAVGVSNGSTRVLRTFPGAGATPSSVNGVSWSPDGERILLTRAVSEGAPSTGTRSQHWLLDADNGDASMFYESPRGEGPVMEAAFSPRGDFIAFDGYAGSELAVFRADGAGADPRRISEPGHDAFRPRWEAQLGEHLLYIESGGGVARSVITPAGGVLEMGAFRHLPLMVAAEWAPRPGPLPPGAVPPSPPVAETPLSPPSAGTPVVPPAGVPTPGRVEPPDAGSGPMAGNRPSTGVVAVVVFAMAGGVALVAARRLR